MRLALPLSILLALAPLAAQAPGPERMRGDREFLCSPPLEGRAPLSRGADANEPPLSAAGELVFCFDVQRVVAAVIPKHRPRSRKATAGDLAADVLAE